MHTLRTRMSMCISLFINRQSLVTTVFRESWQSQSSSASPLHLPLATQTFHSQPFRVQEAIESTIPIDTSGDDLHLPVCISSWTQLCLKIVHQLVKRIPPDAWQWIIRPRIQCKSRPRLILPTLHSRLLHHNTSNALLPRAEDPASPKRLPIPKVLLIRAAAKPTMLITRLKPEIRGWHLKARSKSSSIATQSKTRRTACIMDTWFRICA